MSIQYGQYPDPILTVAHLSDPHLLIDALQYDAVDTVANFRATMRRLTQVATPPQALVFTGDLADKAQPEAYRRLKEMVEPIAADFGAQVVIGSPATLVSGNRTVREMTVSNTRSPKRSTTRAITSRAFTVRLS